jgi:hypothetical protein
MKKLLQILITASLITTSVTSYAHPSGHHYWGHNHYGWVAPLVIGSAVGYVVATRPQTVVIQQPPPNIYQPQAPYGYHYENILDANCNCYRLVLIQNQP